MGSQGAPLSYCYEKFFFRQYCEALEQAAMGDGGVAVPGDVQNCVDVALRGMVRIGQ